MTDEKYATCQETPRPRVGFTIGGRVVVRYCIYCGQKLPAGKRLGEIWEVSE